MSLKHFCATQRRSENAEPLPRRVFGQHGLGAIVGPYGIDGRAAALDRLGDLDTELRGDRDDLGRDRDRSRDCAASFDVLGRFGE